ncbi:transcriptional regulator family: Fungal Specific TF, partial [Penicillium manginii]|uniref:transcriptional regulator family: Fungal Specific TF n=1 Tax=Penicillium manginii TaxID=203109 RepID=UPI002546FA62
VKKILPLRGFPAAFATSRLTLCNLKIFRRKKTKCSGERPICFHCRRNRVACLYEPYSATIVAEPNQPVQPLPTTNNYQDSNNTELLNRISTIESRLAELSEHSTRRNEFVSPSHKEVVIC